MGKGPCAGVLAADMWDMVGEWVLGGVADARARSRMPRTMAKRGVGVSCAAWGRGGIGLAGGGRATRNERDGAEERVLAGTKVDRDRPLLLLLWMGGEDESGMGTPLAICRWVSDKFHSPRDAGEDERLRVSVL